MVLKPLKTKMKLAGLGLVVAMLCAPSMARAQEPGETAGGGASALSVSTTTSTIFGLYALAFSSPLTTTIGGGILLTIVLKKDSGGATAFQQELNHRRVSLMQDLSVGGGEDLEDLSALFEVAPGNRALFARALRPRRDELVTMLRQGPVTHEQALQFARIVVAQMQQHAPLRADIQRAMDRAMAS